MPPQYKNQHGQTVEAWQYQNNGLAAERVAVWCGGEPTNHGCRVKTTFGVVIAGYGDWIVKEPNGTFRVVTAKAFKDRYRAA